MMHERPPSDWSGQPAPPAGPRDVRVAPFWARAVAFALDAVPVTLIALLLALGFGLLDFSRIPPDPRWAPFDQLVDTINDQPMDLLRTLAVVAVVGVCYGVFFEALVAATPGKRVLGLRVIDRWGRRAGPVRSVVRNATKALSLALMGVGALWAAFDPERRALHDHLAGTWVEQEQEQERS